MNNQRTITELVGQKINACLGDKVVVATIEDLDKTYPTTAYAIVYTKADNPTEDIPADCGGIYTIIHCSQVVKNVEV